MSTPADRWPRLPAELVARLALPTAKLREAVLSVLEAWPTGEADAAYVERALSYPWARPAGSFVLEGPDRLGPITPAHEEELAALARGDAPAPGTPQRFALLASGSNGAPDTLIRKFEYLPPAERRVLSIAGTLRDFDVGAVAGIVPYGAFPATTVPSPGAAVHCSLLWVTEPQLQALTWSELSYGLGRLRPIRFEARGHGHVVREALVYVSRWGHLTIDDAPVALEAMPAEGRTAVAWSQERLLGWAAGQVLGEGSGHRALLQALAREPVPTIRRVNTAMAAHGIRFAHDAWTPYPGTRLD